MSSQQPTASVTGQHGWEWNQLQAKQESQATTDTPSGAGPDRPRVSGSHRDDRGRRGESRRDPAALEAELERKERQLQRVIDQYERVISEKNEQLTTRTDSPASGDGWPPVLSRVLRYLAE